MRVMSEFGVRRLGSVALTPRHRVTLLACLDSTCASFTTKASSRESRRA